MDAITLIVPKQVAFTQVNGVEKLVLINPTALKLAVKVFIRTNHKTALNIHPTHQFIEPNSRRDVIVKLVELHQGVKLQVNYTVATEEMIAKNDSKLTNVDKKDLKKQIAVINVSAVKPNEAEKARQPVLHSDDFMSVAPQKVTTAPNKTLDKKLSLSLSKQSDIVVEQKLQEDEEENQEKVKKLRSELTLIQSQIQAKRESILSRKSQLVDVASQNSVVPPAMLPAILIAAFLIGSLLKAILF